MAVSMLVPAVPESVALHALTAGVMAAMVTRVILGHTGRPLSSARDHGDLPAGHLGSCDPAWRTMPVAAVWVAAFALFVLAYSPMLLRRRLDAPA